MSEPITLFCIGATKAGTSWLYRYLHDHPQVWLRSIKEIHFFDTWEFNDHHTSVDIFERHLASLQGRLQTVDMEWRAKNLRRQIGDAEQVLDLLRADAADPQAYLRYLREGGEDCKVVGDLTPAYAMLPKKRLADMAQLGSRAVFIYVMRDPVARLWSHVRMQAVRQRDVRFSDELKAQRIMNRVIKRGAEAHIPMRGDYRTTIRRLQAVVAPENCLFEFTENLGTPQSTQRICDFLTVDHVEIPAKDRVHQGAEIPMRDGHQDLAAQFLSGQYKFVQKTFGDLPQAWIKNLDSIS